jgi:hypothetical protein
VSMTCGICVQFSKCEIWMLGKFVSIIASCTRSRISRGRGGYQAYGPPLTTANGVTENSPTLLLVKSSPPG